MPIDIENDDLATALKKLKARENNLRRLESISGLGSWEVDIATKKAIWSDRSYEIYGLEKGSPTNLDLFFSLILPEYVQPAQENLAEALRELKPITFQCKARHSSGKIIDILINGQIVADEEHKPVKILGTTQDITEQITLEKHSQELSNLIEYSSNEIYILAFDTLDYLYVNQGACKALGYKKEELLSMNVKEINPFLNDETINKLKKHLLSSSATTNRSIHKRKDGSLYHVQSYLHSFDYQGKQAYVLFDTDISQEVELEVQYKKQAKILEYIHDSVIATDTKGKITSWNRGSRTLFGYTEEEMLGKNILETYDMDNRYSIDELFLMLKTEGSLDIEAYMLKKNKQRVICDISLSIFKNDRGEVDGYVGYIQDITAQKKTEYLLQRQTERLQYQAHHDTLTKLPNRTLFHDRLSQAIVDSKRNHEKFALLFIDLDQFKKINDSLGHHIGDKVLIEAAARLRSTLRENDTLARLGGDEFTIILKNIKSSENAAYVAEKIIQIMKEPILCDSHTLYVTSSVGICIYPDHSTEPANLIKYSDSAMYKAKDQGRNNYQFYSADMTENAFERVVMESSLRAAIAQEQFTVHYQPQFDTKSDTIVGMEALIRWEHPTMGLIPPGKFIPLAEESGLIVDIDRIVMRIAMQQFQSWYEMGYNPGILSLNLAMRQLNSDDFVEYLKQNIKEICFHPRCLELEVTEGQVMQNPHLSIEKLNTIHDMGIEIAIDDFGTGYSSLSYLKKLPLDKLKIDRSFISDIPDDDDDVAITKAIIALAKSLNLKIVAEGVETQEQRDFIVENECDYIQGYFYSKPLPAEDIEKLLAVNEI